MATDRPQHQTPSVMNCPMLQIVDGCTHGKCRFCDIFWDRPFRRIPMDQIEADLDEISKTILATDYRINLIGGNPYALPADALIPILRLAREKLPYVRSFGGFCRVSDVLSKSDEDLRKLRKLGVNELSIGAESGYDPILEYMEKGHSAADEIEAGRKLHEAGIDFTFFYLAGLAGAGNGIENARASAAAFSAAAPGHILVVSITPCKQWKLAEDIASGAWVPPGEIEMIEEIREFVANLTCDTYVNSSHDTDIIRFEGLVPKDQQNMLTLIDKRLPMVNEKASRKMREMLHKATFGERESKRSA